MNIIKNLSCEIIRSMSFPILSEKIMIIISYFFKSNGVTKNFVSCVKKKKKKKRN